jgi:hypothetical protein
LKDTLPDAEAAVDLGAVTERLKQVLKTSSWAQNATSGAEAQMHFQLLNGTNKLVPFPSSFRFKFFRNP